MCYILNFACVNREIYNMAVIMHLLLCAYHNKYLNLYTFFHFFLPFKSLHFSYEKVIFFIPNFLHLMHEEQES